MPEIPTPEQQYAALTSQVGPIAESLSLPNDGTELHLQGISGTAYTGSYSVANGRTELRFTTDNGGVSQSWSYRHSETNHVTGDSLVYVKYKPGKNGGPTVRLVVRSYNSPGNTKGQVEIVDPFKKFEEVVKDITPPK